jgi:nucleoside-diphosphate-sugar epimerase
MKICITGALGHIGSKLIHKIRPHQFSEVRIIDNLSTQRYCSLFNLPKKVNFKFYEEDIFSANLIKYFKNIDIVIHLAAITDATTSFNKPKLVEKINYYGTKKVAEACIKNNCRLIFPSTTSVYGTQKQVVDENCSESDLKPQSPYADSKLKAEKLLIKLGKTKKLHFIICRFGTIYGPSPGMRFHTAVNKFIWQAIMDQPLSVWQTAMYQKRPYLDIDDATNAINYIINKDLFNNEIYNIVTNNYTVNDILKVINKQIKDIKINYVTSRIMNQLSYVVSNKKFRQTNFQFLGNLAKGTKETIQLFRGIKNN